MLEFNLLKNRIAILCLLFGLLSLVQLNAQNISINENGAAPDNSAMLDITSTNRGLLIPRMTAAQRLAITSPTNGLMVFQTDIPRGFYAYFAANNVWTRLTLDSALTLERVLLGGNDAANNSIINLSRIGIGTTTPVSQLHIVRNEGASRVDGAFIDIQNNSGVNRSMAGLRFKVNTSTNNERFHAAIFHRWVPLGTIFQLNFAIRDNATTANVDTTDIKMTINHLGRIGMGLTNPSTPLHIRSTDFDILTLQRNGTGGAAMHYRNDNYDLITGLSTTGAFGVFNQGDAFGTKFIVLDNGNTGIGTTTPSRRLQVHDAVATSSFAQYTTAASGQGAADGFIMGYADAVGAALFNAENSNLAFATNNAYRMWLNPSGNLGIGTASPVARLHLNGTGTVTQVMESSAAAGTWLALRNTSVGGQYHQIISTGSGNGEGAGKMLFGYGAAAGSVNGIAMTIEDTRVGVGITDPITRLHLNHISGGPSTGFSLSNQSGGADRWHFYVFTTDQLALYFNDNQRGTFNEVTGVYSTISDIKLKKNIKVINDSFLNRLKNLEVKEYHFITQNENEEKSLGFIAQELKKEFPSLVTVQQPEDGNGETLHLVDYSGLSVVAIKAIQEQQEIIDQLVKQMKELQQEINLLKSEK